MGNPGKTVKTDVVLAGMFGQRSQNLAPHGSHFLEMSLELVNRLPGGLDQ